MNRHCYNCAHLEGTGRNRPRWCDLLEDWRNPKSEECEDGFKDKSQTIKF